MSDFRMIVNPVNLAQEVHLPEPWPALEARGFHSDLMLRAKGFMLQSERLGFGEPAREFLRRIGDGFAEPFRASDVLVADDADRELKRKALAVLEEMADEYGDRVSSIVWKTYAFLVARPNPTGYATILASQAYLPFPWWVADTVLHGTGKVYGFMLDLHTRMFQATGLVFEHNCDCGCDVHGGDSGGCGEFKVNAPIRPERKPLATAALFSHLLGESLLIMALKMPFEMGLSPEAAEAMAIA